jgi:hypothetical protein
MQLIIIIIIIITFYTPVGSHLRLMGVPKPTIQTHNPHYVTRFTETGVLLWLHVDIGCSNPEETMTWE